MDIDGFDGVEFSREGGWLVMGVIWKFDIMYGCWWVRGKINGGVI